jgi:hypothetical protein
MFTKINIDYETNLFEELSNSIEFENITKGRIGTNLVDYKNNLVPIVRTTTNYNKPAQRFLSIHYDIIENIKKTSKIEGLELNNALIEIYDSQYRNMKFHSDQALDLAENSYICIFSCYDNPVSDIRKLKIKEKTTEKCSEILMEHNSVIIFSTETNNKYVHKIVLETNKSQNKWLGITFRLSKTFVQFINGISYFYPNNKMLRIANKDESNKFRQHKCVENLKLGIGYKYPEIDYTISISDTLPIK